MLRVISLLIAIVAVCDADVLCEWDGWCSAGESNCCIWLTINATGNTHTIEFDSHGWGFVNDASYGRSAELSIPLTSGTEFYVRYYSTASSSYGAFAEMEWWVYNLTITDTGGTSLAHETWGSIKTLF